MALLLLYNAEEKKTGRFCSLFVVSEECFVYCVIRISLISKSCIVSFILVYLPFLFVCYPDEGLLFSCHFCNCWC